MEIKSVGIGGVTADVRTLQQKVQTLSEQMEIFFQQKKIEVFDKKNWNRVQKVGRGDGHFILEATLDSEPIPNSVEVFEGVLLMPEQLYHVDGNVVRFPSNEDRPEEDIVIKYYPKSSAALK